MIAAATVVSVSSSDAMSIRLPTKTLTTFDDEGGELRDVLDRDLAADDASPALLSRSTLARCRPPPLGEKVLHEEDLATIVNGMPDRRISSLDLDLLSKCGMPVARSAPATRRVDEMPDAARRRRAKDVDALECLRL